VVVLDEEIGTPMTVQSISWKRAASGTTSATLDDFRIYMGYCSSDVLGTVFDDNYLPGTRTLVFQDDPFVLTGTPEEWMEVVLDTPFHWDGSSNLLIDLEWSDGSGTVYVYNWNAGSGRCLSADYGSTSGIVQDIVSHLQITGDETAVEQRTFGGIKAQLGSIQD
jgi:hypothetical protein